MPHLLAVREYFFVVPADVRADDAVVHETETIAAVALMKQGVAEAKRGRGDADCERYEAGLPSAERTVLVLRRVL
jgi:hypothetical protein